MPLTLISYAGPYIFLDLVGLGYLKVPAVFPGVLLEGDAYPRGDWGVAIFITFLIYCGVFCYILLDS